MRDSTVLVVLLLATLGTVTDSKWDSVTIKAALKDRGITTSVPAHCSTECNSN